VACGPWAIAFPAESVDRLLSAGEALPSPPPDLAEASPAHLGRLAEGPGYSAWDLGVLLGVGPQSESWVLGRVPGPGGELRLAFRTGSCLSVAPLPAGLVSPLPPTLSLVRPGLFAGAFAIPSLPRGQSGLCPLGLVLDLSLLLVGDEPLAALRDLDRPPAES
jgi:hypothetical protein